MSGRDDDRPSYLDRPKKSFSELDRERREGRAGEGHAPSAADEKRSAAASKQYLKEIDGIIGGRQAVIDERGRAMLDARGTPELPAACRAFLADAGSPSDLRYVSCFLDAAETDLVLVGLEALRAAQDAGALEATAGLRTQLRMLVEDPDDAVAGCAEDLLEAI